VILGSEQVLGDPVGLKLSHQQVESEMMKLLLLVVTARTELTVSESLKLTSASVRKKLFAPSVLIEIRHLSLSLRLLYETVHKVDTPCPISVRRATEETLATLKVPRSRVFLTAAVVEEAVPPISSAQVDVTIFEVTSIEACSFVGSAANA